MVFDIDKLLDYGQDEFSYFFNKRDKKFMEYINSLIKDFIKYDFNAYDCGYPNKFHDITIEYNISLNKIHFLKIYGQKKENDTFYINMDETKYNELSNSYDLLEYVFEFIDYEIF